MANIHSPKSFFFTSLVQQSSKFTFWHKSLIDWAQTSDSQPWGVPPQNRTQEMMYAPIIFSIPSAYAQDMHEPCLTNLGHHKEKKKGAEGTNPKVWLVSTAILTDPIITYRPKLCCQQPPTFSSSSLFTGSGRLAQCTSPHCWSPGSIRRSWAHE